MALEWSVDGRDWPHRAHSRFVARGGARWHVQVAGSGPALLLVHGAGASSHSFRDLLPLLAARFTVVAPDLPGHAFTEAPEGFRPTLPALAEGLRDLLAGLDLSPAVAVGHSAGAAVLARMALDRTCAPRLLVGMAAALVPFGGAAGPLFAPAARLLSRSRLVSRLLALQARTPGSVERLVQTTGSSLDRRGLELYQRLARDPGHVAGVLAMLSCWDLAPLLADLPRLRIPLLLLAGETDQAVPLAQQRSVAARIPTARLAVVAGTGHLLHEERPAELARLILQAAEEPGETTKPGAAPGAAPLPGGERAAL